MTAPESNVSPLPSHREVAASTCAPIVDTWPTTLTRSSVTGFLARDRADAERIALMHLSRLTFWCGEVTYQRERTASVEFHLVATSLAGFRGALPFTSVRTRPSVFEVERL